MVKYTPGFVTTTFNPFPTFKRIRSCWYAQNYGTPPGTSHKAYGTKKGRTFKFGLEVSKTWKDIIRIDDEASNKHWKNAVAKEITAFIHHKCVDFKSLDFKPSREYQYVRLYLVYYVKPGLTTKQRLVYDVSQVGLHGISARVTVVLVISVRLLVIIADSQHIKVLIGDAVNAFI